jgi:transposase InsO family protein
MVLLSTLSAPSGLVSQPVTSSSTSVIGHLATSAVSSSNSSNVCVVDNSISGSYYETSVMTTPITWLMDSGTSCHVTPHRSDFIKYHLLNNPKHFGTAASGHGMFAEGVGVIAGYVDVDGRLISTCLTNVYHIPQAATQLFSTGTIERNGYTLLQGGWRMSIFSSKLGFDTKMESGYSCSGGKLLEAKYSPAQNVYYFDIWIEAPLPLQSAVTEYDLWHRRYGHCGNGALSKVPSNTTGSGPVPQRPDGHPSCKGCAWGKSHRRSYRLSSSRALEPCQLIHGNLNGLMRTLSIDGFSYFFVLIDDYSDLAYIVHLKAKSAALQAFQFFKAWAENQTQKTIKKFRSDRGGEFTSAEFKHFLESSGIKHNLSAPDTPMQNGRAERFNRTIMEKALSMLHFAGLSHGFWKLAVEAALHVYNQTPKRRLNWRTPIAMSHRII